MIEPFLATQRVAAAPANPEEIRMQKKWRHRKKDLLLDQNDLVREEHVAFSSSLQSPVAEVVLKTKAGKSLKSFSIQADKIFVKIQGGSFHKVSKALEKLGSLLVRTVFEDELYVFSVPEKADIFTFLDAVDLFEAIEYVEPIPIGKYCGFMPTDPGFSKQWHHFQLSGRHDIESFLAWDTIRSAPSVTVAVLDDGTKSPSPWNKWVNSGEISGNGLDDDQNGWVDDVNGINAYFNNVNNIPTGTHGPAVANLIAGKDDTNPGIGVAPEAKIMMIYIGNSDVQIIPTGIRYAVDHGASIINMSLAFTPGSVAVKDEIMRARDAGVIVVTSIKDNINLNTTSYYPACYEYDNIVSVGTYNSLGQYLTTYGQGSSWVDIAAPGKDVYYDSSKGSNSSYAAALVSGTIALMIEKFPELTYNQLLSRLYEGSKQNIYSAYVINGRSLSAFGATQSPFDGATPLANGWKTSWMGDVDDRSYPNIHHESLGWLIINDCFTSDSVWFWSWNSTLGWFWTSQNYYPYIWHNGYSCWMWYQPGTTNPCWFYRYDTQTWITITL
jgi:hypothetical protein